MMTGAVCGIFLGFVLSTSIGLLSGKRGKGLLVYVFVFPMIGAITTYLMFPSLF